MWRICTRTAELQAKVAAEGVVPWGDDDIALFNVYLPGPRSSPKKFKAAMLALVGRLRIPFKTSGEDLHKGLRNYERRTKRRVRGAEAAEEAREGFDPVLPSAGMALAEAAEVGSAAAAANKGKAALASLPEEEEEEGQEVFALVAPRFREDMLEGLKPHGVAACQRVLSHLHQRGAGGSTQHVKK